MTDYIFSDAHTWLWGLVSTSVAAPGYQGPITTLSFTSFKQETTENMDPMLIHPCIISAAWLSFHKCMLTEWNY